MQIIFLFHFIIKDDYSDKEYFTYFFSFCNYISTGSNQKAIAFHLEGLKLEGYKIPQPKATSSYVEALLQ